MSFTQPHYAQKPEGQPDSLAEQQHGCPFDVTAKQRVIDSLERNELAWKILQEFFCYEATEKEKDLVTMFLLRSYARNRDKAFIPNPVKETIAGFIGAAPQNFKKALDELQDHQIILVKPLPQGWEVTVTPPPWPRCSVPNESGKPKRLRRMKAPERRKFLAKLEESIGHLQPELPLIGIHSTPEAHEKTGEERPSSKTPFAEIQQIHITSAEIQHPPDAPPAIAFPEFQQTQHTSHAPAPAPTDEIHPLTSPLKEVQSFSSSKLSTAETLKALKAEDQTQTHTLSPVQKQLRKEVLDALTPRERVNWGGRWTNWIKLRADVVERALADYREESKRAAMGLRDPITSPGGFMADFVKRVAPELGA